MSDADSRDEPGADTTASVPDGSVRPGRARPRRRRLNEEDAAAQVTFPVRVAAAWSWRILLIVAAIAVIFYLLSYVSMLAIAFMVAVLFAALLSPVVAVLRDRWRMGKTGAALVGVFSGFIIVLVLLAISMTQVMRQFPLMIDQSIRGLDWVLNWIVDGPIGVESEALQVWLEEIAMGVSSFLTRYGSVIASSALTFASRTVSLIAGAIIMLFTLFFMLRDGRSMWIVAVRSLPRAWRTPADEAAIRGWITIGEYVRTQIKVAAIDSIGIGLGAIALGVPLALPIMVLVFLFAFVPIVGAFASGGIAVLIALVNNGWEAALVMLIIVLLVQQLESNVLQPWLMANAVSLHPVAVLFAVTAGGMVAGIAGAVFAVPLLAFLNVVVLYLHGHDPYPGLNDNPDRPGGPPGSLAQQIQDSYRVSAKGGRDESIVANKVRERARARAEQKGHVLAGATLPPESNEVDVVWDQLEQDDD